MEANIDAEMSLNTIIFVGALIFGIVYSIRQWNKYDRSRHKYPTLIKDFSDHPEWCKNEPAVEKYKEVKLGQIVLDNYGCIARVIHICPKIDDSKICFLRLTLVRASGESASLTENYERITIYNGERLKFN